MKIKDLIINGAGLAVLIAGLAACNDDIHDFSKKTPSDEAVAIYIDPEDAAFTYSVQWNADTVNTGADSAWAKFPVYIDQAVETDVEAVLTVDDQLVDIYNLTHGTTYKIVPSGDLNQAKMTVSIPAGATQSKDSVALSVRDVTLLQDTNGYLIPLRIRTYTGTGVALNYAERICYLTINVQRENGVYFTTQGVTLLNIPGKGSWEADWEKVSLNLASFLGVSGPSQVTVSVRNDLIADLNASMGTDYQPVPTTALTQSYQVDFAQGAKSKSFVLAGDKTALTDARGYLIPLEITAVDGENIASVTTRKNFVVRVDVSSIWCDLVAGAGDMIGTEIADRSGYNVVKSNTNPGYGAAFANMFNDDNMSFWNAYSETNLIIDLGAEVSNITGVHLRGWHFVTSYLTGVNVAYATEAMYAAGKEYPLGGESMTAHQEHYYLKFSEPVTARYICLNNLKGASSMPFISKFYIYTQE